ncbi:D-methionine transport system ATP-binding protein [Clostridium acetobutylicum]|uniref:Methionine import ATP-binding protein MetN n=1 Tax=Clostridium acetobutylicum (strain ATCC 824 / DSM 792 / JCM 1419 / IAM 19013 / LMG 5710 / NBRC 13948 / NRRL B-527 / VKM B-1787 / 2291 / W) TaxID=272562 RepID=METN_CLOAB|nr:MULTISPECIES: methionine ABC transporter ATP-binding protein [Clostridium]Q97KD5.1 RecName: Full=Methionine import ATP-binding protein MetN [Clostridium acetobutylicum ATCC 824]AAK78960.1 ABC transporter, ATP-binding protein [Clostridium acetobutylicum ATCC 824]ADZ20034.1 ABC transporter, ATP-binding protein [Clostridium acetobutylicum EA 2018]AEI31534.1 ABC transporter, ATP-binding protein [Clostridium acetobutylicum DSM 1731]AWV81783.1 methionine ABC transporter ATP-binding protein [Clost
MIEIKNVSKYFSGNKVLKDVDLKIKGGEIFGIVGHSGAGKSTLLRCINGLETYDEGNVIVFGKDLKQINGKNLREFRKEVGMIFQNFNLLNRKDVYHNISLPLEVWGVPKNEIASRVKELLELVDLTDKIHSKPSNLSGGQKQRVAIARALALNPKILLCDEATSALDPNTTKSILNLLRTINSKLGITIVIVTHQMEVVKGICERVALIDAGVIKETGDVENLFLNPSSEMKKLIGQSDDDVLPKEGINIRVIFPKNSSEGALITSMARELNVDFSIVWGKLERFRDDVLGSLVINISEENKEVICNYLVSHNAIWEVA